MLGNLFAKEFREAKPQLNPPIHRWVEDMPESMELQLVPPELSWINCKSDIFIEIPRYGSVAWGMAILGMILALFFLFLFISSTFPTPLNGREVNIFLVNLFGDFIFFSCFLVFFKIYFLASRDEPIRLNRKRQKIYTFNYKQRWWNPWMKWPSSVRSYNWADVHGELGLFSTYGGGAVMLYGSVCQPGTYNVTERFLIAAGAYTEVQQIWSYLCQYMQHEDNLPEPHFPGRPDFWCPRKADKWPVDMEVESTTAPEGENYLRERKCNKEIVSKM